MLNYSHQEAWQTVIHPWQSPINIDQTAVKKETPDQSAVSFLTPYSFDSVEHHGNNLQFNGHGQARLNGRIFEFKQLHFHFPAEHLYNGMGYPFEWHFVHQDQIGHLAVVAFWVTVATEKNPAFAPFFKKIALKEGQRETFSVQLPLPEILKQHSPEVFNYLGSLTTPPLTRSVEWWVFKDPLTASKQQLQTLHEQFSSNNARKRQAIADRPVILFTAPQNN